MTSTRTAPATLSALLFGGIALAGCGVPVVDLGEGPEHRTTDDAQVAGPVSAVEVRSGSGDVRIRPGRGSGVSIHRTVRFHDEQTPHPGQRVEQSRLTFTDGCHDCSIDYELTVPAEVKVTIRTSSGNADVQGVATADLGSSSGNLTAAGIPGTLLAHSTSGNVTAGGIGGDTDLESTSGRITATALRGSAAHAKATSGDLRLVFATPPKGVDAQASSGNVTVRAPGGPYRTDVGTGSGDLRVSLPIDDTAPARIRAHTTSGDLTLSRVTP
jgi:hypothetical protein